MSKIAKPKILCMECGIELTLDNTRAVDSNYTVVCDNCGRAQYVPDLGEYSDGYESLSEDSQQNMLGSNTKYLQDDDINSCVKENDSDESEIKREIRTYRSKSEVPTVNLITNKIHSSENKESTARVAE